MIYKYLKYNYLKYVIYILFILILLLTNLYIKIDLKLISIGIIIAMILDTVYGVISCILLEKDINKIRDGKFNIDDKVNNFHRELIVLAIKRLTDDYLIQMKSLEKEKEEYEEYLELWIHEIKIEIANITQIISSSYNNETFRELENLSDLVERIIAIKNSENININNNFQKTKLSYICNQAIKLQMNNLLANNIEIKTDYDDSQVIVDSYWMIFIVKQLINNSIKYGASKIEIKCDKQKIIVIDNGIGIDNNELELVFQKFYCSSKTKENIKSTGIGLYLVRKILNKFKFKIVLENNTLDGISAVIDMNRS